MFGGRDGKTEFAFAERFERMKLFFAEAAAGVFNHDEGAFGGSTEGNDHAAFGGDGFERVIDEIREHALEGDGACGDAGIAGGSAKAAFEGNSGASVELEPLSCHDPVDDRAGRLNGLSVRVFVAAECFIRHKAEAVDDIAHKFALIGLESRRRAAGENLEAEQRRANIVNKLLELRKIRDVRSHHISPSLKMFV